MRIRDNETDTIEQTVNFSFLLLEIFQQIHFGEFPFRSPNAMNSMHTLNATATIATDLKIRVIHALPLHGVEICMHRLFKFRITFESKRLCLFITLIRVFFVVVVFL